MTPEASKQLLDRLAGVVQNPELHLPGGERLTKRERQVAKLAMMGFSRAGTAQVLSLREQTVAGYRKAATKKTGLTPGEWAPRIIMGLRITLDGFGPG